MSTNEFLTKKTISILVDRALIAIKDRKSDPTWYKAMNKSLESLNRIGNKLKSKKHEVDYLSKMMSKGANKQGQYQIGQSKSDQSVKLLGLEEYLAKKCGEIHGLLVAEFNKYPWEGKGAGELWDNLANEVKAYDDLLTKSMKLLKIHDSNPQHAVTLQEEIMPFSQIPNPTHTAPGLLFIITMYIRLYALYVGTKAPTGSISFLPPR
ncbi:hypothetical protein [uncultured Microbulbifer sp.]|uniref:hypothetical protein n=1 Tax=uncultured Microbulbifer sp. TaxID=348147 RepID=UPI00261804D5|nr:hypothetical protein [uncultured Microbulbifer sp.]